MSPHMQEFIQTEYFMFNSKYDAWQLANELQVGDRRWKAHITPCMHACRPTCSALLCMHAPDQRDGLRIILTWVCVRVSTTLGCA
jgi:hypothetical protein